MRIKTRHTYTPRWNVIVLKTLRWVTVRFFALTGWYPLSEPGDIDRYPNTGETYGRNIIKDLNTLIELSGGEL